MIQCSNNWIQILHNCVKRMKVTVYKMKKSYHNYPNFLLHQKNPAAEQKQVQLTLRDRHIDYSWFYLTATLGEITSDYSDHHLQELG